MPRVVIDKNVDDQWPDVRSLIDAYAPLYTSPPSQDWDVDLECAGYLGPDAAALTLGAYLYASQRGIKAHVRLPKAPPKLQAFCAFSGLDHLLNKGPRPHPDHPDSETVPLQQFYQSVGNQAAPIVALVKRHLEITEETEFYLGVALSEVIQNIEDHADSPIGGVWCARYMSSSRQVRVAVVDHGVGIAGSLGRHRFPGISSADALRRVTQGGSSSKTRDRNMGLGIANVVDNVKLLRGDMAIASGGSAAILDRPDQPLRIEPLNHAFPGTAVFFRLNVLGHEGR